MATIKDVAKRTGLSLSTISKYLNGGNVREENRAAIDAAVRELDYSVNVLARSLKANRSMTIGVLLPTLSSPFFGRVVTEMEPLLRQSGYECFICSYDFDRTQELEKLEFLARYHVDGIVYVPQATDFSEVRARVGRTPVILLDRTMDGADCDTVVVDNLNAVYVGVEHLIGRGHRRIGLIAGPQSISTARERAIGYRRVLEDYCLPVDEMLIAAGNYDLESGSRLFGALLDLPQPPTAMFVTNYDMTIGALMAAHERGVRLPEDLDFIGYDNVELFSILSPRLEIVEQPTSEIARRAAELLIARLSGDRSPGRLLRLKARITTTSDLPARNGARAEASIEHSM